MDSSGIPPWRVEVWCVTHGPKDQREKRWFLATITHDEAVDLREPTTGQFVRAARSVRDGLDYFIAAPRVVDPETARVASTVEDMLRQEVRYLRSREEHYAQALGIADGGRYRNDWTAPLKRVLDENQALRAQNEALRAELAGAVQRGGEAARGDAAALLARMAMDRRTRARNTRGGEAAVFLESDAEVLDEAEKAVAELPIRGVSP